MELPRLVRGVLALVIVSFAVMLLRLKWQSLFVGRIFKVQF
jgi:hypothetical protein